VAVVAPGTSPSVACHVPGRLVVKYHVSSPSHTLIGIARCLLITNGMLVPGIFYMITPVPPSPYQPQV
jgi:hypothetical protein